MLKIADPTGPYTLLASLDSVEATDPTTVTMKLKKADAHVARSSSRTTSRAIVPNEIYPADKKQPDDKVDRLGPVQARQVHAQPAGRVRGQPELHRPEQGADAELHRPVLRAGRRR